MDKDLSLGAVLISQESGETRGVFSCLVGEDFQGFEGHFKDNPILPGICQVHWAVEAASMVGREARLSVKELENVKFHNIMSPGAKFELEVELVGGKWRYELRDGGKLYSSGRIVPR